MHAGRVSNTRSAPTLRGGLRPLAQPNTKAGRVVSGRCDFQQQQNRAWRTRCSAEESSAVSVQDSEPTASTPPAVENTPAVELDDSYICAMALSDLPKGERREVVVDGKDMLVFWYRSKVWACEGRSPAEGAYSTGFIESRFTEDYGIQCPDTDSVFSIKTGEILEWYPFNPVLSQLIPRDTCRKLETYPVEVVDEKIYISFTGGSQGGVLSNKNTGGAKSSLEGNNVFFQEPPVYVEGSAPGTPIPQGSLEDQRKLNPVTVIVGTLAVALVSVSGTGFAIYNESVPLLIGFWLLMLAGVGSFLYRYIDTSDVKKD
ncbi:hypothetical protein BSKO_06152 [Bryopsis sp. KO-2023]|nr:hypothetical protein BSKO_06152 [Bryopsis sp. KO-2023]